MSYEGSSVLGERTFSPPTNEPVAHLRSTACRSLMGLGQQGTHREVKQVSDIQRPKRGTTCHKRKLTISHSLPKYTGCLKHNYTCFKDFLGSLCFLGRICLRAKEGVTCI